MVGDGINDAPALAAADVGAAIAATPSDAAAAAADVLLLNGSNSLALVPGLLRLARRTRRVVRQNLAIAAVSIACSSLPAAFGLFPLWLAVLLHEGSTLLVAFNSLRLLDLPTAAAAWSAARLLWRVVARNTARAALCVAAVALAAALPLLWPRLAELAVPTLSAVSGSSGALQVAHSAWAGLAAGALHTLTGADHLAALTPLTIGRSRLQGTLLGGLWGMGHNTGQVIVGCVFLALKERLNLELLESGSRLLVGLTLVLIGFLGAREALGDAEKDGHSHSHGGHSHSHSHGFLQPAAALGGPQRRFVLATYATGVVHGLQPDALFVLLPSLALPAPAAAAYLATFLGGTVLAMATYTAFIGAGTEKLRREQPAVTRRISLVSSAVALAIGGSLLCACVAGLPLPGWLAGLGRAVAH